MLDNRFASPDLLATPEQSSEKFTGVTQLFDGNAQLMPLANVEGPDVFNFLRDLL